MLSYCEGLTVFCETKPTFKVVDRPLFRKIETGRNRTEPPVDRRLSFEAVP